MKLIEWAKVLVFAILGVLSSHAAAGIFDFGDPTVDGSSEEAFEESLREVSKGMTDEEIKSFSSALMVVTIDAATPDDRKRFGLLGIAGVDLDSPVTKEIIRRALDGLTAAEIVAEANSIKIAKDEALEEWVAEVEEGKAAREAADKDWEAAQKAREAADKARAAEARADYERRLGEQVLFRASNFRVAEGSVGLFYRAKVDFHVSNRSGTPMAGLVFYAEMRTPGRAIPWYKDDSQQMWFDGGIENGETREEDSLLRGLGWHKDFPKDAVFSVKLLCVYGPPADDGLYRPLLSPPEGTCKNIRELR